MEKNAPALTNRSVLSDCIYRYICMWFERPALPACLPGQIGECVSWCVWSEDEQNIETFLEGAENEEGV